MSRRECAPRVPLRRRPAARVRSWIARPPSVVPRAEITENLEELGRAAYLLRVRRFASKNCSGSWRICVLAALLWPSPVWGRATTSAPTQLSDWDKAVEGRPTVVLDRLIFPQGVVGAKNFERHLERVLKREAHRADWGAGQDNRIEYRFEVTELQFSVEGRVLRVHCEAMGRLPRGQKAKSELSFGGFVGERTELTKQVLEIVARGVITRLAQLERRRRGLR